MKNILVIAPHPDDEELGCGGTIAKFSKQGHKVQVCYVTKAYTPDWSEELIANRRKETEQANHVLGVKQAYFLDFPTVKLDTIPQKALNDSLFDVVKKTNPEIIFLPHGGDLNKDHRLVFEAGLVAARPGHDLNIQKILCYETVSETEWGADMSKFQANVYENIDGFMEAKLRAMQVYKSEVRPFPHPRSAEVLSALAIKRGSEAGLKAAEGFMLIRETVKE